MFEYAYHIPNVAMHYAHDNQILWDSWPRDRYEPSVAFSLTQLIHDVIITSLLRQNHVVTLT